MPSRFSLSRLLILTTLFAILAVAPALAGTSPAAPLPGSSTPQVTAPAADFLAALSADLSGGPGAAFLSGCTSSSQCPTGQLCCLACGFSDCTTRACFQPVHGGCPHFV